VEALALVEVDSRDGMGEVVYLTDEEAVFGKNRDPCAL